MAWKELLGECAICKRLITFNRYEVSSIMVLGQREPICKGCAKRLTSEGKSILKGAYEWLPESE